MAVKRHEDLVAWQLGTQLRRRILAITAPEDVRRDLRFCTHIREAGASVSANIAGGFGRFSTPDFRRFLRYSRGSVGEAKDRLLDGLDRGHFSQSDYEEAVLLTERTAGAITQLILSLDISPP